jgi:two-component system response regulator HydG
VTLEAHSPAEAARPRVLVIDDDPDFLRTASRILARAGFEVTAVDDPVEGLAAASEPDVDVVVSDIQMPHLSGMDLLREIRARRPGVEVVLVTAHATVDAAVAAMKAGAYDYLTKPLDDAPRVALVVQKAAERKRLSDRVASLESQLEVKTSFEDLVGQSRRMTDVFRLVDSVAYSSATILLQGESGTGKELVARAIHRRSPRKDRPFLAVNCSALTETLLESELFGHAKGAFTGAVADRRGLFEAAHGGTLFLDEIGDMPVAVQARLLRVLQEGEIRRVGSDQTRQVDVRVVAASNVDLARAKEEGRFREDLFFRLNVIAIHLPPLRDRPEDVAPLARHFVQKHARKAGKRLQGITREAMEALASHDWPGNVRELENAIERAVVLARDREVEVDDLPPGLGTGPRGSEADPASLAHLPLSDAKRLAVGAFERRYLKNVLRRSGGNVSRAAESAGVDRANFRRLLKQYGVAARGGRPGEEPEGDAG